MEFLILLLILLLLIASYQDLKYREVDGRAVLGIILFSLLLYKSGDYYIFKGIILATLLGLWTFFDIGGADIKLIGSLIFSVQGTKFLMFSFFLVVSCLIIYYFLTKKKDIPFIPFITISYIVSIVI